MNRLNYLRQSDGGFPMSLNSDLVAIVTNPNWIEASHKWLNVDGHACDLDSAPFGLTLESWKKLQSHFLGTGWFIAQEGKIAPSLRGQEFLERAGELHRALSRANEQDKLIDRLLDQCPRGPAVDIGCGPGYSVLKLARMGYKPLYAYDHSPVALVTAQIILQQNGKTAHLYAEDATPLSQIKSSKLALAFSRGALHYFDQLELAKSLKRTLRPGGRLIAEIVGLSYYLQRRHFKTLINPRRVWQPISYGRTILRTALYDTLNVQPRMAAGAPEIGYTRRTIYRLARRAGLEVLSILPSPTLVGYIVVMQKPAGYVD
jgi:SAM-dependent methyltransferase